MTFTASWRQDTVRFVSGSAAGVGDDAKMREDAAAAFVLYLYAELIAWISYAVRHKNDMMIMM